MEPGARSSSVGPPFLPIRAATAAIFLVAGAILGALGLLLSGGSPASVATPAAARAPDSAPPADQARPSDGYASVVRAAMPAVVNISSLQVIKTYEYSPFLADPFFRQFFGDEFYDFAVPRERRSLSLGSGVLVDDHGTILTNNHVVEHSSEVKVSLADGREFRARLLGADRRTDLAVLRIREASLPKAILGDSERLQVGDIVLAIGNPFGIGQTVTMGIVSAIGRGNLGLADYEDFIQTDAAINPGNSGGALINTHGEVVGISTAILSRSGGYQGIGFAIPSNMARDVLDSIVSTGRVVRGYVGFDMQAITPEIARGFGLADTRGALVAAVDPRGPAAVAGLRRGDIVLSIRGHAVSSDDDLRAQLSRFKPGEKVTLALQRDGRRREVELTLGEPPVQRRR